MIKSIIEKLLVAKNSSLSKASFVYTISTFCNSAIPFLLLPVLTRYLTTEEYGIISMFNAVTSIVLPFVSMSAATAILRKMVDEDKETEREYIFNCLLIIAISGSIASASLFFLRDGLFAITGIPAEYIYFVIAYPIACAICEIALATMQIQGRVKSYALFLNLNTLLNAVSSIVLVVGFGLSLCGRLLGIVIPRIIFAVIGLFLIARNVGIRPRFDLSMIIDELRTYGFPMIPTQIKSTILTYVDKLFITNMISVAATGVYAVGNQFSMPILLLAQSFNLAYVPWLFEKLKEGNEQKKKMIVKFTYIYFIAIICIALAWSLCAPPLVFFFIGADYYGSTEYVIWLSLGYAFTGMHMMVVNYIYYMKKLKAYAFVTIGIIFSNIGLNYLLISANGSVGAAQATMIANALSFVLTWILSARICKMPWASFWRRGKNDIGLR